MADDNPLVQPAPAPALNIPDSQSTVTVRIINTTGYGSIKASFIFTPELSGFDTYHFASYAFLVTNNSTGQHVLYDLGMRKDWRTALPLATVEFVKNVMPCTIEKNIEEILDADVAKLGIKPRDISSVIWSHHHFDHRGDISAFPTETELVLGPGFLKAYAPGYPTDPKSSINESELTGRPVRELDDTSLTTQVGRFPAHDFFGDGSFYLLSSPGHTVGHLCALARVTTSPKPTFVFMGGDCAHHPSIFRPSTYLPLPSEIPAVPGSRYGVSPCPGQWMVDYAHPKRSATEPFVENMPGINEDQVKAAQSVSAMQEFDAHEDVLVCIAHDTGLIGNLDFYPETLNGWQSQGRKRSVRWNFCGDIDVKSAKMAVEGSQ